MKGSAVRTIVLLVMALLAAAVILFFLTYVTNFDSLFLSNDQRVLKQYSTCVLAYCASGADSDEVKAVGCLKSEGGKCALTCQQVKEQIYDKNPDLVHFDGALDGKKHYCGSDAKLEFEFSAVSLSGTVPLKSGQMDKLANKPQWVCRSFTVPFTNIEIDDLVRLVPGANLPGLSTADILYNGGFKPLNAVPFGQTFPQNCIMLSKSIPDSEAYGNTLSFLAFFAPEVKAAISAFRGATTFIRVGVLQFVRVEAPLTQKIRVAGTALKKGAGKSAIGGSLAEVILDSSDLTNPQKSIGFKTKGGCFTGFAYDYLRDDLPPRDDVLYTPIIQYYNTYPESRPSERVYPSAIYVDEGFTKPLDGYREPECTYIDPATAELRNKKGFTITDIDQEREKLVQDYISKHKNDLKYQTKDGKEQLDADAEAAGEADLPSDPIIGVDVFGVNLLEQQGSAAIVPFDFGNILKECKFKTTLNGKKIKYHVWASPTFPSLGTFNRVGEWLNGAGEFWSGIFGLSSDTSAGISNSYKAGFKVAGVSLGDPQIQKQLADFLLAEAQKKLDDLVAQNAPQSEIDQAKAELEQRKKDADAANKALEKENEKDQSDATKDFFSQFGSCAYVVLSRDLPNQITVPSQVTNTATDVKQITLATDQSEYDKGATVKFSGKVETKSGKLPSGNVRISITATAVFGPWLGSLDADIKADGTFEKEFTLTGIFDSGATFSVTAEYDSKKSNEVDFKVK